DSLKVNFFDRDSLMDSVMIRRPRNDEYNRHILITNNLDRNRVNRVTHLHLQANAPINRIDRSKIVLLEDSVRQENFQLLRDSVDNKKFFIRYNWKPKLNYLLTLEESTLTDHFDHTNEEYK